MEEIVITKIEVLSALRCNSPIPERTICPVSSSLAYFKLGSSFINKPKASSTPLLSPVVLGSTEILNTGGGTAIGFTVMLSSLDCSFFFCVWDRTVSPVFKLSFTMTPMLPALISDTSSGLSACMINSFPILIGDPLTYIVELLVNLPEYTLTKTIKPLIGSVMTLKAKATVSLSLPLITKFPSLTNSTLVLPLTSGIRSAGEGR
ncbi:hypothetical protein WICPIJ_009336 [Wickerhamomyces pijperi]|uniref:Uncharacterized protein n=1 Tax=Wickerhamomyces pijperi TaxID=599730 RepID=A0A9P8PQQ3_WICPI|nr:hypothetical protein WICPIJ_009336 [Wickerhamomyces pijperi]